MAHSSTSLSSLAIDSVDCLPTLMCSPERKCSMLMLATDVDSFRDDVHWLDSRTAYGIRCSWLAFVPFHCCSTLCWPSRQSSKREKGANIRIKLPLDELQYTIDIECLLTANEPYGVPLFTCCSPSEVRIDRSLPFLLTIWSSSSFSDSSSLSPWARN